MKTHAEDEAEILRLDSAWNEAYLRRDRRPLANILADDFTALDPSGTGKSFGKAMLMINPDASALKSMTFSEQSVHVFGNTAISRGRIQLEFDGHPKIDQRFVRIFAKRDGAWRAVSVCVTPVPTHS